MAEVFRVFETLINGPDGNSYLSRICGRPTDGGRWEGWIEFEPSDGSPALRSRRETLQPGRRTLELWASGLTMIYLEGALARTLSRWEPRVRAPMPPPAFEGPAPEWGANRAVAPDDAPLNPFQILGAQGEEGLYSALEALSVAELRKVVRAFRLADYRKVDVDVLPAAELIELVVQSAAQRLE